MNIRAFEVLGKYKLPIPAIFSINEVKDNSPNSNYFLRYSPGSGKSSEIVTSNYVLENENELQSSIENNQLLYIEKTYDSIIGGASLIKDNFIYTEVVSGHPVTLLRRGVCAARVLTRSNKNIICITNQKWKAFQTTVGYSYFPIYSINLNDLNRCLTLLNSQISNINGNGLLLEWFITKDEIIFCDGKDDGFIDFANDFEYVDNSRLCIYNRSVKKNVLNIDCFDVDFCNKPQLNDYVEAVNGAILSHYITRHLNLFSEIHLLYFNPLIN